MIVNLVVYKNEDIFLLTTYYEEIEYNYLGLNNIQMRKFFIAFAISLFCTMLTFGQQIEKISNSTQEQHKIERKKNRVANKYKKKIRKKVKNRGKKRFAPKGS